MAFLLAGHAGLLIWSGYWHTPTHSEVFHLASGVSHIELGRFDLYRVNPPLIRSVAALPVMVDGPHTDWRDYDFNSLRRAEYSVGLAFFTANDTRSIWLVTLARWACIPFSILGGWICFHWASHLYGTPSGFVALILWITSPYILGHGALITPDAHAAAMGVTAGYFFWAWLQHPQSKTIVGAAVTLGLAELTKFTLLMFYPLWLLIWLIYRLAERKEMTSEAWIQQAKQLCCILVLSIVVINLGYLFEGSGRSLRSFHFKSRMLTGVSADELPEGGGNRFKNSWSRFIPIPLPANFIQGVDTQKADFEREPWSYLNGEWRRGGWWYFYFYALLVKIPLGTWSLIAIATLIGVFCRRYCSDWRNEVVLLLPILTILVLLASQSGLSLHSRYAIPILPYVFIWISKVAKAFQFGHKKIGTLVSVCLVWSVGSSLYYFPSSLSYFNELVGGPCNGYCHLAISDSSWGQDLKFLNRWINDHPEAREMRIAVSGPLDPRLVGLQIVLPPVGPHSPRFDANLRDRLGPVPGWFAIDTNLLIGGDPLAAADGKGAWETISSDVVGCDLSYFQRFKPVAMAGYSIFIYRISLGEANSVRKELGLPELFHDDVSSNHRGQCGLLPKS